MVSTESLLIEVLLRDVNEEVRLGLLIRLLEVAVGLHAWESRFSQEFARVVLPQRKHVQVVRGAIWERVLKARQPVVDVLGLGDDVVAAVVVRVLRLEAVIEDAVVVALVDDQHAIVFERGIELRQRSPAVLLFEEVGERVSEADDRVELPVHLAVQPTPVGVDRLQDVVARFGVLERLGEHGSVAIDARHLEPGVEKLDGVEAGAGGHVEHLHLAARLQQLDEEAPLALGAGLPVDQLVPLLDEALDVLGLVVRGVPDGGRARPEVLGPRSGLAKRLGSGSGRHGAWLPLCARVRKWGRGAVP